jgi:hypothetical protein
MTDQEIARLIAELEKTEAWLRDQNRYGDADVVFLAAAQLRADHPEGGAATASHACYAVAAFLLKHTADSVNYRLMLDVIEASDAESARATYGLRAKDAWPEHALRDVLALGIAAPVAVGPEAVDEALTRLARETDALGLYDDSTKPTYAAQAEAVERAINFLPVMVGPEWRRALSAAAATLRAVPWVVDALTDLRDAVKSGGYPHKAMNRAEAALRALEKGA